MRTISNSSPSFRVAHQIWPLIPLLFFFVGCTPGGGAGIILTNSSAITVRIWLKGEHSASGVTLAPEKMETLRVPSPGDYYLVAYTDKDDLIAASCTYQLYPDSAISATFSQKEGKGFLEVAAPGGKDTLIENASVPSSGEVVQTKTLEEGHPYLIIASGAWGPWDGFNEGADALYIYLRRKAPEFRPSLLVDEGNFTPEQSGYQPNHTYTMKYVGKGAPVSLRIKDTTYEDNTGGLTTSFLRLCR